MGNDVFGVLDPSITSGEEASRATTHIRPAFEGPLELPDLSVSVEVSIGAAVVPEDGAEPDLVLLRADVALSVARARSEHTARCGNEMETGGPLVPQLLAEPLEAIRNGEIVVHYQPRCSTAQGFALGPPVVAAQLPDLIRRIEERLPAALGRAGATERIG
ncbi:MAG: diguanylate cyclase [Dermatophilaceae bacterium]|nr:diguanylate cyclase [Dermatophilaceae bacterium]